MSHPAAYSAIAGLASLTSDLLLLVISLAATPQSCWLPPRPDEEEESRLRGEREAGWFEGTSADETDSD